MTETELRDSIRASRQAQESAPVFVTRILVLNRDTAGMALGRGELGASIIVFTPTRVHMIFRGLDVDQDDQP